MKTGGQAFPVGDMRGDEHGMTLRDYFAGQALAGLCSHDFSDGSGTTMDCFVMFAKWSYNFADNMIAERDKEEKK